MAGIGRKIVVFPSFHACLAVDALLTMGLPRFLIDRKSPFLLTDTSTKKKISAGFHPLLGGLSKETH